MDLFIVCGIAPTPMTTVMSTFGPYLLVLLAGLLIIAFIPWITLVLPERVLGLK